MILKKEYKSVYITTSILTLFFVLLFIIEMKTPLSLIFKNLENKWHDFKFNENMYIFSRLKDPDERVIIAAIDDKTLKNYGWPLPRRYYARLIKNLNSLGVKFIAIDIIFLDEDKENPQNDEIFADELSKTHNVALAVSIDEKGQINLPIKKFLSSAKHFASVAASPFIDNDGSIRRFYVFMPTVYTPDGNVVELSYKDISKNLSHLHLPLVLLGAYAYSYYKGISLDELYIKFNTNVYFINFRKNKKDSILIHDFISFSDIVEDKIDEYWRKRLKDAIVFVGTTAQAAYDHYPTPAGPHTPGVEIHALGCDNLLNDDYLTDLSLWIEILILLVAIWMPVFLLTKSVVRISMFNFAFIFILMCLSIFMISKNKNLYFAPYFISNVVVYTYVVAYKSIVEDRQKRWIKNTFSQYLSPEVVDVIVKDPSKLKLGGERKDMTIFFMDIVGFTSMSEKMTPHQLTNLLNEYLSELSEEVLIRKGVIDKYIGDCIMAFWNAPLDVEKHRTLAVETAVACMNKIEELNKKNGFDISIRIGINSGEVVVGNMGSKKRFSYTVIGDNVNLASRLEGANKFFNTRIMVSDDVYKEAKDEFVFKYIGEVLVVGKTLPVKVWEPYKRIWEMTEKDKDFMENYKNAIKYFYEKQYSIAKEFFLKAKEVLSEDGLVNFYISFIDELQKGMEFDGIFNLRSK